MPQQEKYNLQRLLEMRERAREEAGIYLAECRRILAEAEAELARRELAVEDCRYAQRKIQNQLAEQTPGGMKTSEILRFRQHLIDLREHESKLLETVEEQKKTVNRHAQTVDKALNALQEAAKETKVIEKHRENWTNDKRIESNRREQKTNDEIGAILHERHKLK